MKLQTDPLHTTDFRLRQPTSEWSTGLSEEFIPLTATFCQILSLAPEAI